LPKVDVLWSPVSCRSSAGQGKFASQRPTFYCCATQPTNQPNDDQATNDISYIIRCNIWSDVSNTSLDNAIKSAIVNPLQQSLYILSFSIWCDNSGSLALLGQARQCPTSTRFRRQTNKQTNRKTEHCHRCVGEHDQLKIVNSASRVEEIHSVGTIDILLYTTQYSYLLTLIMGRQAGSLV